MDPINSVLRVLPTCFVVNFSGFREIITIFLFFFGIHGLKNDLLVLLL